MSTNPVDPVEPNGHELTQDELEVVDEASLAQVVGAGGLARILNVIPNQSIDLNADPIVAIKPEKPEASTELPRPTKKIHSWKGNPLPFGLNVPKNLPVASLLSEGSAFHNPNRS